MRAEAARQLTRQAYAGLGERECVVVGRLPARCGCPPADVSSPPSNRILLRETEPCQADSTPLPRIIVWMPNGVVREQAHSTQVLQIKKYASSEVGILNPPRGFPKRRPAIDMNMNVLVSSLFPLPSTLQ
jgi:hypothetical protein